MSEAYFALFSVGSNYDGLPPSSSLWLCSHDDFTLKVLRYKNVIGFLIKWSLFTLFIHLCALVLFY